MRTFFIYISIFLSVNLFAQAPVIDVAANKQLGAIHTQIANDDQLLLQELKNISNKLEENNNLQQDIKEIQTEIKDRQKREEEALFIVPDYIKNGTSINNILDSEFNILSLIQELRRISQSGNIDIFIDSILNLISDEVDIAVNICTDNIYRMTPEERVNYLKDTEASMLEVQAKIQEKLSKEKLLQQAIEEDDKSNEDYQKLLNKKITPIQP